MSNDNTFINGLIVKAPHDRAPEYVKAKLSIRREELIAWLQSESGDWINADIKVSQNGKWYAQIDAWKPDANRGGGSGGTRGGAPNRGRPARSTDAPPVDDFSDDIPFLRNDGRF